MYQGNPYIQFPVAAGITNDYSVVFDGVDEEISTSTSVTNNYLSAVTNFSWSVWIKISSTASIQKVIAVQQGSGSLLLNMEVASGGTLYCRFGSANAYTDSSLSTGQWYHVALAYDGGGATNADKAKLYIDGSLQTSHGGTIPTTTPTNTNKQFWIGTFNGGAQWFNGYIDEVAIFDYTLSSGNISTIYNSGTPTDLDDLATSPVCWWRMGDGDTYPTITDVGSGAGYDGTMANMESGDIQGDTP